MPTTKKAAAKGGSKKAAAARPRNLTVGTGRNAKFPQIVRNLEVALGKIGCRGCRSGLDKIVIGDTVMKGIK
jgi:hypothetical protein